MPSLPTDPAQIFIIFLFIFGSWIYFYIIRDCAKKQFVLIAKDIDAELELILQFMSLIVEENQDKNKLKEIYESFRELHENVSEKIKQM